MAEKEQEIENVTVQLRGEDALRFREYKKAEFIELNSAAGGKLIKEGLARFQAEVAREAVSA